MMTLYELNDLVASYQGLLAQDFTIYLSILSAYLAVAYVVGARLTRVQVVAISTMFVFAGLLTVGTMLSHMVTQTEFRNEIRLMSGGESQTTSFLIPVVFMLGLTFCLLFMWNVRRPRKQ